MCRPSVTIASRSGNKSSLSGAAQKPSNPGQAVWVISTVAGMQRVYEKVLLREGGGCVGVKSPTADAVSLGLITRTWGTFLKDRIAEGFPAGWVCDRDAGWGMEARCDLGETLEMIGGAAQEFQRSYEGRARKFVPMRILDVRRIQSRPHRRWDGDCRTCLARRWARFLGHPGIDRSEPPPPPLPRHTPRPTARRSSCR